MASLGRSEAYQLECITITIILTFTHLRHSGSSPPLLSLAGPQPQELQSLATILQGPQLPRLLSARILIDLDRNFAGPHPRLLSVAIAEFHQAFGPLVNTKPDVFSMRVIGVYVDTSNVI